jgi:hypothetical protein
MRILPARVEFVGPEVQYSCFYCINLLVITIDVANRADSRYLYGSL